MSSLSISGIEEPTSLSLCLGVGRGALRAVRLGSAHSGSNADGWLSTLTPHRSKGAGSLAFRQRNVDVKRLR